MFAATDRRVEIVGEGGVGHQGHRLAGEHSHAASRCPGEVLSENNILGGAALHQSRATGPREWKMFDGSWRSLPRGQGFRHGRVSPILDQKQNSRYIQLSFFFQIISHLYLVYSTFNISFFLLYIYIHFLPLENIFLNII